MPMTKAQLARNRSRPCGGRATPCRIPCSATGCASWRRPVLDVDGYPVAAVSVAAPAIRLSLDEFRARALAPVRAAAAEIARAVQASGTVSMAI